MTNGEKIKEVFPTAKIYLHEANHLVDECVEMHINDCDTCQYYSSSWWNAEYKEPTTTKYCDRNICLKNEYNNIGCEDCEVTKIQDLTTKNNLGVDAISREQALNEFCIYNPYDSIGVDKVRSSLKALPSVTPQEPQSFKWCTDCKEYDQEKHCCHRWSKVIRDTIEEMKQESFINKPCVSSGVCEHDKEVALNKIRAEIESTMKYQYAIGENQYAEGFEKSLEIIDKYKAESEDA